MTGSALPAPPAGAAIRPLLGYRALAPLRRYRRVVAVVAGLIAVQTAGTLAGPMIVREIIGRVEQGAVAGIGLLALSVVAAYALRSAAAFGIFHYAHVAAFRTCHDTRLALYAHIQRMAPAWFARRPSGEVVARVTEDSYRIEPLLADSVEGFVTSAMVGLGVLIVMLFIDPALAFVAVAPLPVALAYVLWQGRQVGPSFREESERGAALAGTVQDHVGGMIEIQGFARERAMRTRLSRGSRALARREIANRTLIGRFDPAVDGATGLAIALVVWVGGTGLASGRVEVADLIAVLLFVTAIYQPLYVVVGASEALHKALAAMRRIEDVLATAPEIAEAPGAVDPRPVRGAIAFEDVRFGYEEGGAVLHGLSFAVAPGETVAIVGPTGAGKSTVAALLSRFHDPQGGRVTLDGRDLRDLALRPLRESVARVSQDVFLFDATVREVVAMGREGASREEIRAALAAAEALSFVEALPQGLDTRVGERGVRLSGGQKQRLSVARAVLKDAPVLVLDEATSAIDAATEARLRATLDRLMEGRTAIVIAHRLSTVRGADRILVLDGGRIAEEGTHIDLLARGGRYAALARAQLGTAA
ncbi:MAG: ABC transporter ATP-binding protein [Roseicyclus sp.]|nr:ABC transporter ATP-binding protein [Roseicyclus sp.]